MQNEYLNTLLFFPDEKLIEIITTQRDEYLPQVVATAEHLLKSRGYEIEYDGETKEDVLVFDHEAEPVQLEVLNTQGESSENLGTLALLFGAIIFGVFGLIALIVMLHSREDEVFGVIICFGLAIFLLITRRKAKKHPIPR